MSHGSDDVWLFSIHQKEASPSFSSNPSTLSNASIYLVVKSKVEAMHVPLSRLVCQQASNNQLSERVRKHCCFHVLSAQVPFYSTTNWEKFLHLRNVGCCHLSEVITGKWPTEKTCDYEHMTLSSAFFFTCFGLGFFLKKNKTTIKVKSVVLKLSFFCGWFGQIMVPTHFAVVIGFISPHEKQSKSQLKMELERRGSI